MKLAAKILKFAINVLMIAACVVALTGIAIGPVWEFKATVYFNEELADKLSGVISGGSSSENGGKSGTSSDGSLSGEEIFKQAIDEMAKDNVKVPVSLKFSNSSFMHSIFDRSGQAVDDLIDGIVDEAFGEEFKEEVEKIKKSATKGATKVMVKQAVLDIKNGSDEAKEVFKDKNADEILAEAGLSDEELDDKIEVVYDVLTQGKTVEEAADSVTDVVKEVYDKIKDSEFGKQNPDIFKDTESTVEDIKKEVSKVLVVLSMVGNGDVNVEDIGKIEVTDEMLAEGMKNSVDLSGIFDKILLESLNEMLGTADSHDTAPEKEDQSSGGVVLNNTFAIGGGITLFGAVIEPAESVAETESAESAVETESAVASETAPTDGTGEEDVYEQIKTMIKTKFKSLVPNEYRGTITIVMIVIAALILLNAFVWICFLVLLVINTISGRFDPKIKIATLFGWEMGFNLVILPTILFKIFTTKNAISTALNISVGEISKTVGLTFASGSIFAFYATIAVIGLWIVGKILNAIFKTK